jgi:hypothetical protein
VGARSVTTSDGATPVVVLACWKNRRAVWASRRADLAVTGSWAVVLLAVAVRFFHWE